MYNYRVTKDPNRRQSLDYRYQLTHDLLTNLHRGECCGVVGVGSCGKSRLLLHLSRPETLEYHLGNEAYDHFIVLVECNALLNDTIWAVYEGITRSLNELLESANHPLLQSARRDLSGLYQAVVDDRDLAFKHLTTGLGFLLKGSRLKLTFCLDEFDFVFEKYDAQIFRNLRALRNQNKYQLTYLAATRRQLPYQRAQETWPDVEEFYELFTDNTYAIGPYDEKDATEMLIDLETRYEYKLKKGTRDMVIEVTGGHPGLIGAAYRLLETAHQVPSTSQQMAQLVISDQSTWKECRKIMDSLRQDERTALKHLADHGRPGRDDGGLIQELKAKGLVREINNRGNVAIFSPILREYAHQSEG
jgi:hypothetical protein